jgi:uncharacterized protein YabE (DUF348 family)
MEKKIINEEIFCVSKSANGYNKMYTWGEVKEKLKRGGIELQDSDTLKIQVDESLESSSDDSYIINVRRERLETDEEFEKRKNRAEDFKKINREERYKRYLELKKEFEND